MVILLGASYFVALPGYLAELKRRISPTASASVQKWRRDFIAFGIPLALMNVALLLSNLGTQLILSKLASPHEAGIFAAFSAPIERLVGFSASIAAMAFLPLIASQWDAKHYRDVLRFLSLIIAAVLFIAIVISAALIAFAGPISAHTVDARYLSGTNLIPLLCAATTASTTAAILADILILQKKTPQLAALFLTATVIGLLVSGALVPFNGATGAVTGRLLSGVLACVFIGVAIRRNLSKSEIPDQIL
jgi:O-antigen/teichoic acid export membrane protein